MDETGRISEGTITNVGFRRDGGVIRPQAPKLSSELSRGSMKISFKHCCWVPVCGVRLDVELWASFSPQRQANYGLRNRQNWWQAISRRGRRHPRCRSSPTSKPAKLPRLVMVLLFADVCKT